MDIRAILGVVLGGVAMAQTTVVLPASHATHEGSSSTNVPFGRSSAVRVQQVYDGRLFAGPGNITRFDLRLDGGTTVASKQVDCEIRMSTSPLDLVLLSADFASNRGADETVVLPRQLLTLPALTTAALPSPFHLQLALTTPFAYDPALGALVVEITVFGQPPGAYGLDATYVCDSPEVAFGPIACPQPGANALRVDSATTQVIWGRPWVARVTEALPGALTVLVLGTDETTWGGWVLPADLGVAGAPGCYLSTDMAATFLQPALGDGSATYAFVIPNNPAIVGLWLRYQAGALNANANAAGFVTSQAKKAVVCGWEPVGRVWAAGLAAVTGTREIGVAPVAQVVLQ